MNPSPLSSLRRRSGVSFGLVLGTFFGFSAAGFGVSVVVVAVGLLDLKEFVVDKLEELGLGFEESGQSRDQ